MLDAIKDLISAIAVITLFADLTCQQEWLWKQISALRCKTLIESRKGWGAQASSTRRHAIREIIKRENSK